MCCLSSFPHLDQLMDNETQFYLALLGQIVTGVGGPLATCLATRISQSWFGESERTLATSLMTLIGILGQVFLCLICFVCEMPLMSFKPIFLQITSLSLTPVMVGERPENIPYMNIAWFIPAIIGSILTAAKVKVSPFPN